MNEINLNNYRTILQKPSLTVQNLPSQVADWVEHHGSLTQKLLSVCGDLKVQITWNNGWKFLKILPLVGYGKWFCNVVSKTGFSLKR